MEDKYELAISAYDLSVRKRYRSRGGWMLETDQGLKLLREYETISNHFIVENKLKEFLMEHEVSLVDQVMRNRDNHLVTELDTGEKYVLYQWFVGEECNLRDQACLTAAGINLGRLHRVLADYHEDESKEEMGNCDRLLDQWKRHNRELKRINSYLKNKKRKNEFEVFAINCFGEYYEKACEAVERLEQCDFYGKMCRCGGQMCHGDYNYHNLIMTRKGVATTGFEKCGRGIPLLDLTYFLRKTMEKNGWRTDMGEAVLCGYEKENPLRRDEIEFVLLVLLYPEKYWKLMNHYYNKKKSWISSKSLEKLRDVKSLEKNKETFLRSELKIMQ